MSYKVLLTNMLCLWDLHVGVHCAMWSRLCMGIGCRQVLDVCSQHSSYIVLQIRNGEVQNVHYQLAKVGYKWKRNRKCGTGNAAVLVLDLITILL